MRALELGGKKPPHDDAEPSIAQIHQNECEQKIGNGKAEKTEDGRQIVTKRIFAHCRIDADRERNKPHHDDREALEQDRVSKPAPDQLGNRTPPFKALAEIAGGDDSRHPFPILNDKGLAQTILFAQGFDNPGIDAVTAGAKGCNIGCQVIAGR